MFNRFKNGVNLVRAGLIGLALAVFFAFGYLVQEAGGLYFGLPFWIMLAAGVLVLGLILWDTKTEGNQAWIIVPMTIVLAVVAVRVYNGLDEAGEREFMASLRAAVIVLLGIGVSLGLSYTRRPVTAADPVVPAVAEPSATVTAPHAEPVTL